MPLPRFVVTGCARSGTLFMAEALAALGHPCGHEQLFTPSTSHAPAFGDAQGDVSWLAAPFLGQLPPDTVVLHQVRDPLATIRSMLGVRMFQTKPHPLMQARYRLQYYRIRFARPITNARFVRFVAEHCPGVFDLPDETSRAAAYWVRWNQAIRHSANAADLPYHRYRVEDLDDDLLVRWDHLLGGSSTQADVAAVRASLGTSTHRARQVDAVHLDDVADTGTRTRLADLAADFGYDLSAR
jgi:hypothetical protein